MHVVAATTTILLLELQENIIGAVTIILVNYFFSISVVFLFCFLSLVECHFIFLVLRLSIPLFRERQDRRSLNFPGELFHFLSSR